MAESGGLPLWPVLVAAALGLVGLLVALLWPDPPTSLRVDNPQHNSAGEGRGNVPSRTPYVFVGYPLCVAHGPVTIKSVAALNPTDIRVVDWAASSDSYYPTWGDGDPGHATHLDGFDRKDITHSCSNPQQFAISVERTGPVGTARGFEVRSTSGTAVIPFTVMLCASDCPNDMP